MVLMGIPPLALTGACLVHSCQECFTRFPKEKSCAVLGEVVGTGDRRSDVVSDHDFFVGPERSSWLFYVPSFLCATLIGGGIAYVFLQKLADNGMLIAEGCWERIAMPISAVFFLMRLPLRHWEPSFL